MRLCLSPCCGRYLT